MLRAPVPITSPYQLSPHPVPTSPSQAGDDPLDAPRYACNAPEELVTALCSEMHIRLSNYLRLA
jgi:hypothetical protein